MKNKIDQKKISSAEIGIQNIIDLDPISDSRWLLLIKKRESDVFHSPKWLNVLSQTYGFKVRAKVIINKEDEPIVGLPYIRIDDMFSPRIVTLPFSDFCDALVDDIQQWYSLSDALIAYKEPVTIRSLHTIIPCDDDRFKKFNKANWHGIDLNKDLDELFNRIHSSSRRAIRKAEKVGLTIRVAEKESDLRRFYEMHLKIRKEKYQMLAQSYSFLQNIWHNFIETDQGTLILAEHEGEIIGGVFYLKWKDRLYYKLNASLPEAQNLRPNDLLMWSGIKYAKENGLTFLDLGLSDWGQEGLIRYKQKYATEEKIISFLRHTPEGCVNENDAKIRSLLPKLTDLFTDASVPNDITEKAGDLLYRFFT